MFFFSSLSQIVSKYPKTSEIISAFTLTYQADVICQSLEHKFHKNSSSTPHDHNRSLNLALFRSLMVTPVLHYWYKWLSSKVPGQDLKTILAKSLIDRLTLAPVILAGFFGAHSYTTGGGFPEFKKRMNNDFVRTNKMSVVYWTSLLMVTFRYIPMKFHIITIDVIGFGWMIYLSFNMNKRIVYEDPGYKPDHSKIP